MSYWKYTVCKIEYYYIDNSEKRCQWCDKDHNDGLILKITSLYIKAQI